MQWPGRHCPIAPMRWRPLTDMPPTIAPPYPADCGIVQAGFFGDNGAAAPVALNSESNVSGRFGIPIPLAVSDRSMPDCISPVRSGITPIEIGRHIIERVPVYVADECTRERRRHHKSEGHKAMDRVRLRAPTYAKRHLPSTSAPDSLRENARLAPTTIYGCPFHVPKVGDGIVGGELNGFPYFHFTTLPRNQSVDKRGLYDVR